MEISIGMTKIFKLVKKLKGEAGRRITSVLSPEMR